MKVKDIKKKVRRKMTKMKKKLSSKCGKCAAVAFALGIGAVIVGCQNPAQRAQTSDTRIYIYRGNTVTFGSEFVSLAQSNETGGNDAGQVATPTTDVKPDIDVAVGGMSSGGKGVVESAVDALCGSGGCSGGKCSE